MKKTIFTIFSTLIGFLGFTFADLKFTNYQVLGDIQLDGTINVSENIDAYFSDKMHGIKREIPYYYTVNDTQFEIFIDDISVKDYHYEVSDNYDSVMIKIGDANTYVIGNQKYEINYSTYGLIRNFSGMGYSELYRNVIGYDWSNDIEKVQVELTLPKAYSGFTKDDFLISAGYTDKYSIDDFDGTVTRDENKIYITYNHRLPSYEGITLAVRFPNDYFEYNHDKQESLLVRYVNDYNIENYKIDGIIDKSGNITFQNEIELEVLNEDPIVRGNLPYRYDIDGNSYLVKLKDITINGEEIKGDEYDTTVTSKNLRISGDFEKNNIITSSYSIYGLIRPFSGEFKEWTYNLYAMSGTFDEWAYRLYLELPVLDLNGKIKNLDVSLDVPGGCKNLYTEDIYVNLGKGFINMSEFNENYGYIRCKDDKLALAYSGGIDEYSSIALTINFVKGTFDLDEELLGAFAAIGNGNFYYSDKTNRQSLVFGILMTLFGGIYKRLMDRRYKKKSRMNRKCVIQYDAPRGVDAPEAGVLIDNILNGKDLTSLIYQRAVNHYIKIFAEEYNPKKFYIKKLKDLPNNSKEYQLNLFNSLFESGDEFHFSKDELYFTKYLKTAKKELTKYIDSKDRFLRSLQYYTGDFFKRQSVSITILTLIGLGIVFSSFMTFMTNRFIPTSSWLIILLVGLAIFIISCYRNYEQEVNTKDGQEVRDHCQGFKEFLMKVDKEKLETLMAQDPLYIEKALPYAVVFGVSSKFIKTITPYLPEDIERLDGDLEDLSRSIRYINTYTNSVVNPTPTYSSHTSYSSSGGFSSGSSFGGGFSSGGGGGGGGGGGW